MARTDILPFASDLAANVEPLADYEGSPHQISGFVAGIAQSPQLNRVWRQSSFVAAGIANFIIGQTNVDVPDDGNLAAFITNLINAIGAVAAGFVPTDTIYCGVSAGVPNAQTLTPAPPITSYVTGAKLYVWQVGAGLSNTGPVTINISGLGAIAVRKVTGAGLVALTGGELEEFTFVSMRYNGAQFQLQETALGNVATKNMGFSVNDPGTGALELAPADSSIRVDNFGARAAQLMALVAANRALALADNHKLLVGTNAAGVTLTLPQTSTLVPGYAVGLFARNGTIALAINGADGINGGAAGVGAVVPKGYVGFVQTDGAGAISLEIEQAAIGYPAIASATTTDIGSLGTPVGQVTGNAVVNNLGATIQPGQSMILRAGGAFTLVNGANIIVQGGANYVCAVGDWLFVACIAPNLCAVNVMKADGTALVSPGVTGSVAANGWVRFANGLIMQWGSVDLGSDQSGNSFGPYNFPISFPNAFYSISFATITPDSNNSGQGETSVQIQKNARPSLSQFTVYNNWFGNGQNSLRGFYWMAIGS